jgi:hypothetical protein
MSERWILTSSLKDGLLECRESAIVSCPNPGYDRHEDIQVYRTASHLGLVRNGFSHIQRVSILISAFASKKHAPPSR